MKHDVYDEIEAISRPRVLMNAAKEVVKSSLDRGMRPLAQGEVEKMVAEEREMENLRQNANWLYSAQEHIVLLAQLIGQVLIHQRKRQ